MRLIPLSWLSLTPLVAAWTSITLPEVGANLPGPGLTEAAEASFERAGRWPNATNAIAFSRTYENQTESWTWRVNVTELKVPNFYQELGQAVANASEGQHLINTQWQLQWPVDAGVDGAHDGLIAYLRKRQLALYANFFQIGVASEVASRYSPQLNGDCAPILGIECVDALKEAASSGGPVYYDGFLECSQLQGNSLGTSTGYKPALNSTEFEIYPEDTIYYSTSETFDIDSPAPLYQAEGMLQLLILDFQPTMTNESIALSGPSVLCQVLDKSQAASASELRTFSTKSLLGLTACVIIIGLFL